MGKLAFFQVLALGDDVGAGDGAQLHDTAEAGEGDEFFAVDLIRPSRIRIGKVGEPFEFGGSSARSSNWAGVSGRRSVIAPGLVTRTRSFFMLPPASAP